MNKLKEEEMTQQESYEALVELHTQFELNRKKWMEKLGEYYSEEVFFEWFTKQVMG